MVPQWVLVVHSGSSWVVDSSSGALGGSSWVYEVQWS